MTRMWYREHDYAFGQQMLVLRTAARLTQMQLAELLAVSRRAVSNWEAGKSYPKFQHLRQFIRLCVEHNAFPVGKEAQAIRDLWRASRPKVALDEHWLHALLQSIPASLHAPDHAAGPTVQAPIPFAHNTPRVDWDDALDVATFYGREAEIVLLSQWIVAERCRVISVLGMGGIGKSALVTTVMQQVAGQFDAVIWRSLRDSPSCTTLVDGCLHVLAPHALPDVTASFERRLQVLMDQLRVQRVLLVLDNGEMLLEEGSGAGRMRHGFEGYDRLLQRMGETTHQSCLLLTSREKPATIAPLEGHRSPVRTLQLAGLDTGAATQLLDEKHVTPSVGERTQLVALYQGNPLALKIVAQTIVDVFGGAITPFFEQGDVIFGGVRDLLDKQFNRLSVLEQTVVRWLAVLREPVSLHDLLDVFRVPTTAALLLEAVEGLRRRSLIEQGQRVGSFTLQSVVLEYATARLIEEVMREIEHGQFVRLLDHGLCQAQAKEYVRQTQEQVLVTPLLTLLHATYQGHVDVEARLITVLDQLRTQGQLAQGYGPANLVALLRTLRGHLRGLDLSHLALRSVFLQETDMQDTTLVNATVQDAIFTEPFDGVTAVAMSRSGHYWAAGTRRGDVRVWEQGGQRLRHAWHVHTEQAFAIAFSADERMLASASQNDIKVWDVGSGALLWQSWQVKNLVSLAFSPVDPILASASADGLVRLWNPQDGNPFKILRHATGVVHLAWNLDGTLLATGGGDGTISLWQPAGPQHDTPIRVLERHTNYVIGVASAPNEQHLASASVDGTVKLWDIHTGACLQTFSEHTAPVLRVQWSPDGGTLASCGYDTTIRFWDLHTGKARTVLLGHTSLITNLVFTPDSRTLVSGSYDGTVRVWDVAHGHCVRIIQGYTTALVDLDWRGDGAQLVSCALDGGLTLWDATGTRPPVALQDHRGSRVEAQGVAWSPDGQLLASAGQDNIGLWDPTTGVRLHELRDSDSTGVQFQGAAWSPDGQLLAIGTYGRGVQVWEMATRTHRWLHEAYHFRIRRVAWSPDGRWLAGGDYNGFIHVWDASDDMHYQRLAGHTGVVMSVAWNPDGKQFASGGGGAQGELFVWDVQNWVRVQTLAGHPQVVSAVVWSSSGKLLISGDGGGDIRWWDVERGVCLRVQAGHTGMVHALKVRPDGSTLASCGDDGAIRLWDMGSGALLRTLRKDRPYERLNIKGIRGLSEAQKASLRALGAVEDVQAEG
jgi:WD40 repeat protein/DNA-binding XRE family transcriptional regulator